MYGVMTENEFVEDFYVFNEGAIEREVIQNLLPAVIRNSSNSTSSKEFIHYFRLAEFEKVYLDLSQKHEIERKKIQPEMLQSFVQNLNSLDHECFDSVKQQMGKYLKGDEQLFNQTIDEMRVMMSYNHSMSDFLHLFSKKHEITEMQILKDLADDLIVINNELPHWELKGNAPVELVSLKNQPVIKGEKVGRNDLCPCGSGKKYKKCCLVK
ncbi:MAG: SEC-C domain-containing protein [Clostridia bacterium]|nr:SEC-C domain-containing protein [Clostridia bacterium]